MSTANTESMQLACPHCHSLNRVPVARLAEAPACGRCKRPLFAGEPFELDAATFDAHAVRSELPLLVDFWAPWCGPCRMMAPAYRQAASVLEPRLHLAKVDTQAQPELGARYGIRSIPTLVLLHRGREIARQSGAMSLPGIVQWVGQQPSVH
ncbi:thioredoxin TrxC [Pseudoxanthomonas wuyuanensis]|uniref:Thioredoxin n=1 Tax=Pseudoxanthomonas wuyuanensis TaxID=1073196 RepID=A0A286CVZ1_9GAMM|nr:thioredoxin TrxC [Pseudoxanthomonas wuyuanensis]KAF1721265.1 thioredoxin TrxC [Pseudoxanthomonas wuyuanensis]SOD50525.1 thioredoxin [Pseudoxanthomonas wuyuanensis]